ncbi:tripartite tricarboxylate transporter TctB family protein [Halomonas litopenaei]|uniref:tripartite tricarboxylate transporter TctB family protein n=1 Tax=Halomonas litopenaei TaxID=2109328 RepID=UPI001A8CFA93|nr:tripartite tricarboxylate transporter TctB family protein [Halomonas litopenaei]MBN8412713.1 tripartite tricarboxylate transporter TctB family protein [Halomonas litopenaei]
MTLNHIDRRVALLTGAVAVAAMVMALSMRADAGLFVLITAWLGLLSSIWLGLTSRRPTEGDGASPVRAVAKARLFQWCAALVATLVLMEPLGTFVVVPLFLLFTLKSLARLGWGTTALLSACFTLSLYIVFVWLLSVPLPMGVMAL